MGTGDRKVAQAEERRWAKGARERARSGKKKRDGGAFVALPQAVQTSEGWRRAKPQSIKLLVDIACSGCFLAARNGLLVATSDYLSRFGWTSNDTITSCLRDLIECGLLFETRKGRRPNRCAYFAVTWHEIGEDAKVYPDLDIGAFRTGAYNAPEKPPKRVNKAATSAATEAVREAAKLRRSGYSLVPSGGSQNSGVAPPHGARIARLEPRGGAIHAGEASVPSPRNGACLEHHHLASRVSGRRMRMLLHRKCGGWLPKRLTAGDRVVQAAREMRSGLGGQRRARR